MNLKMNLTEEDITKWGDDGRRVLQIQSARDVPVPGPIKLKVNFKQWEFIEDIGGSI